MYIHVHIHATRASLQAPTAPYTCTCTYTICTYACTYTYYTGLPAGTYCDQSAGLSGSRGDVSGCAHTLHVDWRGRLTIEWTATSPNGRRLAEVGTSALILHTGRAVLRLQGLDLSGMLLVLVAWCACLLLPFALWCRMWRRATIEVRLQSGVCTFEHNRPGAGPVGHLAPPSSKPTAEKAGVLMAGLEHVVPALKLKISAGGLGNVAGLYVERLPCPGKVYPYLGTEHAICT